MYFQGGMYNKCYKGGVCSFMKWKSFRDTKHHMIQKNIGELMIFSFHTLIAPIKIIFISLSSALEIMGDRDGSSN